MRGWESKVPPWSHQVGAAAGRRLDGGSSVWASPAWAQTSTQQSWPLLPVVQFPHQASLGLSIPEPGLCSGKGTLLYTHPSPPLSTHHPQTIAASVGYIFTLEGPTAGSNWPLPASLRATSTLHSPYSSISGLPPHSDPNLSPSLSLSGTHCKYHLIPLTAPCFTELHPGAMSNLKVTPGTRSLYS